MPVRTRSIYDRRAGNPGYARLKARLVDEWAGRGGAAPAPDIEEETDAQGRVVHVLVAWDAWADLDAQTRSEMIVDAFQAVKGKEAIGELSLAMGVTHAEGARFARTA